MMNELGFLKLLFCCKCKRRLYDKRIHKHRGWSLFYIISGSAHVVLLHGRKPTRIDLNPGEFAFLSSLEPHRLSISEADHCHMVHLMLYPCGEEEAILSLSQLREISEAAYRMLCNSTLFVHAADLNAMLFNTLTEILLCFDFCRKKPDLSAVPKLMLQTMLVEISYLCQQNIEPRYDRYVNSAIAYLKGHSTEVVHVADVAAEVGLHPAYLQRIFKDRMHMSLMEYLVQYRVRKARRLLCSTSFPIIEIAMECGFSSRQHFSRCFHEHEGMTPSEYRRRNQIPSSEILAIRTEDSNPDDIVEL